LGLKTYPTYLVNIDTSETKEIFRGDTLAIDVDKDKKQISIFEPGINNYIYGNGGGPHDAGFVSVFDYSGVFL